MVSPLHKTRLGKTRLGKTRLGRIRLGVSEKLLMLTIGFIMLAQIFIYVPSIAQFRDNWLGDRLAAARVAALVIEATPADSMPETTIQQMLSLLEAKTITLKTGGTRRLLGFSDMPPMIDRQFDLRTPMLLTSIVESFDTLFLGGSRTLNIMGAAPMGGDFIDIVIDEAPLKQAMLRYSINILLVSLVLCVLTAALVYLALRRIIIAPVYSLISSITGFESDPENINRMIIFSKRKDEIGQAEQALQKMQITLSTQIKEQNRLAVLGLAVSKINHDLRNMLTSVQLFSDRLVSLPDPTVQRLAPKLMAALDRAISFCESTLSFGKACELAPKPYNITLEALVQDMLEMLGASSAQWQIDIPSDFTVYADPDHLFRVMVNLGRNAQEAVKTIEQPYIRVSVNKENGFTYINIADNGAGVADAIKPKLFQAFNGSNKIGSTGLGLSIAADLMRAHNGKIELVETKIGACFRVSLPNKH
jgi:signal transduction histidine kinase